MKRLRFRELLILADKEKTARAVPFHPQVTILKGENDRGKSCLLKSLYIALGATPKVMPGKWDSLEPVLHLYFSVDEVPYSILKVGKKYTIFDEGNRALGKFTGVTKELTPFLAELFDFRLELTNASSKRPEQATPALCFLPFYYDQDSSWTENWDGFAQLQQFTNYRKAIAEFHTGIKPNAYYHARAAKAVAEERREVLRHDRNVVKRVLDKIENLLKTTQFDIDLRSYQNEIDLILNRCNLLRIEEERIREEMLQLDSQRRLIQRQIHIAVEAAGELGRDFRFADEDMSSPVECPICGQHYENSFVDRFQIAADEDQLRIAVSEMKEELEGIEVKIKQRQNISDDLQMQIGEVNALLEVKQGEVKLNDLLRSEGKKEVRGVLRAEMDELNKSIGQVDLDIEEASREMRRLTDKKRVVEIKDFYRDRMSTFVKKLDVLELDEETYEEVDSHIRESGSDKARGLLAFYFAILKTIETYSTATFCPIVIDSARQQEQDTSNWRKMLEFMRDNRPQDAQMVIGLVDDLGVSFGGQVIELNEPRQLLRADQYESVRERIRPFLDASLHG